ncbi:MAG: cytochrome c oxidase subunit II [Deltaproteobacteria bacterium]
MSFLHWILFLPPQASTASKWIDQLHYAVITTTMFGSTAVALAAVFLFVRYRRRSPDQLSSRVESPLWFEGLIVAGPLTLFLAWFYVGYLGFVRVQTPPPDAMDVYVMAKQWMWKFSYPEGPSSIGLLRVPSGKPVRLLMTSRDVIHSFFVPAFRVKEDVLPGRYTQAWFQSDLPGHYELLCAEYCGLQHSLMRGEVQVLEPAEFDRWLAAQKRGIAERQDMGGPLDAASAGPSDLVTEGQRIAGNVGCLNCHTVDGSPHIGPTWLGLYHRNELLSTGKFIWVDEAYLTRSMMDPMADIVAGFNPVMPTFQGKLSAPQTAALIEFIKSLHSEEYQSHPAEGPIYAPSFRRN